MADIRRESMRIAGEHVGAGERVIEIRNPWNGALVGTVPRGSVADVRRAFAAARAFRSPLSRHERSLILSRAAERLAARREEIADLITAESGLCKKDTLYEVGRACDVFTFASHAALIDDSQTFSCDISANGRRRRIHTQREPLRAISAITPFNHPLNQVAHKVAPSIATNNRMVLKPSEKTPLTALLLTDILYDVGLPPAMLSMVTGDPREIADELITNPAPS
jgi:aldehyde dehydrogenase (NAD+)